MREWRAIPGGLICVMAFDARTEDMVARYRAGETLVAIGSHHGITRERARQIIAKYARYRGPVVGGAEVAALIRRAAYLAERDARYLASKGCTFDEYSAIRDAGGARPYGQQRSTAHQRGIEWRFTLASWWKVWQDSGRWSERGRGNGYCMARRGDVGPYSPENVYICTIGQNFSDSWRLDHPKRRRAGARVGRYKVKDGHRWQIKIGAQPWRGGFPSREAALAILTQRAA